MKSSKCLIRRFSCSSLPVTSFLWFPAAFSPLIKTQYCSQAQAVSSPNTYRGSQLLDSFSVFISSFPEPQFSGGALTMCSSHQASHLNPYYVRQYQQTNYSSPYVSKLPEGRSWFIHVRI